MKATENDGKVKKEEESKRAKKGYKGNKNLNQIIDKGERRFNYV